MKIKLCHSSIIYILSLLLIIFLQNANADSAHWSYEGKEGPGNWANLNPNFKVCKDGKRQSPINIKSSEVKKDEAIKELSLHYKETPLNILNNGHTIQVNYEPGSSMLVGSDVYELLQFHFHTPSEHLIDGKSADMEVHLVHKRSDGQLAALGIMMKVGNTKNMALAELFDNFPSEGGKTNNVKSVINAFDFLPKKGGFFTYLGSLTTPGCSEIVTWYVLKEGFEISRDQFQKFKKLFKMNARPVQSLSGRTVGEKT